MQAGMASVDATVIVAGQQKLTVILRTHDNEREHWYVLAATILFRPRRKRALSSHKARGGEGVNKIT